MSTLHENCDPNLSDSLCVLANVCGYITNVIWVLVLLPQIVKNYRRKTTTGLSFLWASCTFFASLMNLFFIVDPLYVVPLFNKISGYFMLIPEALILLQFALYSKASKSRKVGIALLYAVMISAIVALECTNAFGGTARYLVLVSIALWSIETYFQVLLNTKRRSVEGQSYISLVLFFIGKTTEVIMQFSLKMRIEFVYMTYFSSTLVYLNFIQLIIYTQRRWYSKPVVSVLCLMLCGFIALLILRTNVMGIFCTIGIFILMVPAGFLVFRRESPDNSSTPSPSVAANDNKPSDV
ncbi:hypothetical protein BGZ99_009674 [Dissophora globulifera]|uniref:Uncharacterized protein n=1 Tax=Dissophora globulifera TaxID=979702 RepID=A0A9P6ULW3_9FUNG|nr:hypothetical protein BGZ99_009674 [Dissophora globulifera]